MYIYILFNDDANVNCSNCVRVYFTFFGWNFFGENKLK